MLLCHLHRWNFSHFLIYFPINKIFELKFLLKNTPKTLKMNEF
jgi:hypothetical protein